MIVRSLFGKSRPEPQQQFLSIGEIQVNLHKLCMPPNPGMSASGRRISEKHVQSIQVYLQVLDSRANRYDDHQWTLRPRLYAILHRIGATSLLDEFISQNITDFHLPFNQQTLPSSVKEKAGEVTCHALFSVQDYYLTDAKDIESEKSKHLTLSVSGDTYFVPERPLGHGGHGGVDLVFSRLSTERFARKRVLRARGSEQSQHYLIQELRELRTIHHRHCVQIIGSYTDTEYIAYLMKPVAEITLAEFLSGSQPLANHHKLILRRLYGCLAGAMNYLYANKVRHRDLTARNILLDSAGEVYISDFGSSYNWSSKPTSRTKHRNVPTSPDYMAPELMKGEEHGTKSDMWSLGIVFLEMTTKLLNIGPSEMRSRVQNHAKQTNAQPFPCANLPAVYAWIQRLGTRANAQFDHDKEPLSWTRELLHEEHQHRPTPPQLIKNIMESPSFGVFCCFRCQHDFHGESFAYGSSAPRRQDSDSKQDSKQTREAVEALFETEPNFNRHLGGDSSASSNSINRWLEDSKLSLPPLDMATALSAEAFGQTWDVDATTPPQSVQAEQFLSTIYEQEVYDSLYLAPTQTTPKVLGRTLMSEISTLDSPTDMEAAGGMGESFPCPQSPESGNGEPKHKTTNVKKRSLQDSGLGFLEYESQSSDDERPLQPFEEISDKSSVASSQEDDLLSRVTKDPLIGSLLEKDGLTAGRRTSGSGEFLFQEEEDKSEDENPWNEASDRSNSDKECPTADNDGPPIFKPVTVENASEPEEVGEEGLILSPTLLSPFSPSDAKIIPTETKTNIPSQEPKTTTKHQPKESKNGSTAASKGKNAQNPKTPGSGFVPAAEIPQIIIDDTTKPTQQTPTDPPRTPITPRKRDPLVPLDVRKLMNNTWEMASTAPTSVMSEEGRAKLSKILFLSHTDAQIEGVLGYHSQKGSAAAVKAILSKFTSPSKPLKRKQFFLPLTYAVKGASSRHNKCVRELLAAGVNPNHRNKSGLTPLHIALMHPSFKGYTNLVWLLLSNTPKADPNAPDKQGELPLSKLFIGPDSSPLDPHKRGALIMLLKEGAKANYTLPGTGNTPLHLAVRRKDPTVVAMLLHMGAQVNRLNSSGTSALHVTANQFHPGDLSAQHAEVLDHLLSSGADVNATAGAMKRTALHWAVLAGCAQAVVRLLEAGADPAKKDGEGKDALKMAVEYADNRLLPLKGNRNLKKEDHYMLADHVEIMLGLVSALKSKGRASCEGLPDSWRVEEGECAVETAIRIKGEDGGKMFAELVKLGMNTAKVYCYRNGMTVLKPAVYPAPV
ncbi:hypothetical protein QBC43DRAFT_325084 [Cladorrhinum sp. PSN259]|nr:hypothetical protein QBC43DRAFT_325084 [Cladorrhinum sp. PSN259]